MGVVETAWAGYMLNVLPPDAPGVQLVESKRAFYAGARSMFAAIVEASDAIPDNPTDADLDPLHAMSDELDRFNEAVRRGLA